MLTILELKFKKEKNKDVTTDADNMVQRQEAEPMDLGGGGALSVLTPCGLQDPSGPHASLVLLTLLLDALSFVFSPKMSF